jgi:hypothetical protein
VHLTRTGWSLALVLATTYGCFQETPTQLEIDPGGSGGDAGGGNSTGQGGFGNATSSGNAKEFFLTEVYPVLSTDQTGGETPDCASCHATGNLDAPPWLDDDAESSYVAIDQAKYIAVPENSLLIQHGVHTGPALTLTQEDLVVEWLLMEVEERGLAGGTTNPGDPPTPPTGKTLVEALNEFAACMTLDDWNEHLMNQMADAQTGNGGPCNGCHQTGQGGTWLSVNDEETFDMHKEIPFIKRLVTGTINEQGQFETLIAANRYQEKGLAPCSPDPLVYCHPKYSLPPIMTEAVVGFVDVTLSKWVAGLCEPPLP